MRMPSLIWSLPLCGLLAMSPAAVAAEDTRPAPLPRMLPTPMGEPTVETTALLQRLRAGGLVLLIRHERTDLDARYDLTPYAPDRCERQRNLSLVGHAASVALGEALQRLRIPIGAVIASPYCRTLGTALAAFGRGERDARMLGPDPRIPRSEAQVRADLIALATDHAQSGRNLVLVGHHGNNMVLTQEWLDEGEMLILQPDGERPPKPLARVTGARWDEMIREEQRAAHARAASGNGAERD